MVISTNGDWINKRLPDLCPKCDCCNLVTDIRNAKIAYKHKQVREKYRRQKAKFDNGELEKKPTIKYVPQQVMCMCGVSKCRDSATGEGCLDCMAFIMAGKELPIDKHGVSQCPRCLCLYRVTFPRDNYRCSRSRKRWGYKRRCTTKKWKVKLLI